MKQVRRNGWSMSSIRFWRIAPFQGLFQMASRSSLPATETEQSQRLDISEASRRSQIPPDMGLLSTHAIIIKDAIADLQEDVPCRLLEGQFHVLSRARASFDKQQTFLFRPQLSFFGGNLSISLSRTSIIRAQVSLVADQDARQVRIGMLTDVFEPCSGIGEALGTGSARHQMRGGQYVGGLCREQTS